MNVLEPFQKEGVDFMVKRKHALNADDMGMGKTIQTIECFNEVRAERAFICCPASVKYYWKDKIEEWANKNYKIQVVEGKRAVISPQAEIVIINYHLVIVPYILNQLLKRKFDVGAIDEAHYLQSLESQRSKSLIGNGGVIRNCDYKFMLTGTPISSRPKNLYPMLRVFANDAIKPYDTYERFAMRYCGGYRDKYTDVLMADGATNCGELKERLKGFMIRRLDTSHDLRATYDVVPVHIPNYQETAFDTATARQECAIEKIRYTADYITDMAQSVDKLVVFFYHKKVGRELLKLLERRNFGTVYVDGSVPVPRRDELKQKFISFNNCKVAVAQFQAWGEGVDGLQNVCNHALFYEASWIPRDIQQAVARLKRRGQKKTVRVQLLAVKDSIEMNVIGSMVRKRKLIKKIID